MASSAPNETTAIPRPLRARDGARADHAPASAERRAVERLLGAADVRIGGDRPWDIHVHDARFYARVLRAGALGLGESYMDGWWDAPRVEAFIERLLRSDVERGARGDWRTLALALRAKLTNMQAARRAAMVAEAHYDLGNDFFERMLGPSMVYSCAYWARAGDLDGAQEAKLALVCDKLSIQEGDRVLDVGCGWGSFARYAAERRGCRVTGVTVSAPQRAYAAERCAGLPIEILLLDYRSDALARLGPFDKIVSLGMFEHVGKKNYATFMARVADLLVPGGLFLLQTIGRRESTDKVDVWTDKYIFPNGVVPSPADIARAFEPRFVLEDWHSFGADYEKTLLAWCDNFERFAGSPDFTLGERFTRMWKYYLLSFAGAFKARTHLQLWQLVLSKGGTSGGYRSLR